MNKKVILLVVWLALLGGLGYWISHSNSHPPGVQANVGGPPPGSGLDPATLATQWKQIVAHASAPPRGKPNAPFTIAEFGDFQCPQCGKAKPAIDQILAKYPDKVNLIFIHRPFPFRNDGSVMHEWAIPSAEASEIAAAHGKFWQMYDQLYANQDRLQPGFYPGYAAKIGLDQAQFQTAFNSHVYRDKVNATQSFSDAIHMEQTPTFVVRDNATGKIGVYIALQGVEDLMTSPPWGK